MIRFADRETAPLVRQMWQTCFGDSDEYMDIFFRYKYNSDNTLIRFAGGEAVASLHMIPYEIIFYGQTIPFYYLMGLCTLPGHRGRGYMAELIGEAHNVISGRGIALSILVPAGDSLIAYYNKFGYEQVFDKGSSPVPLKEILDETGSLEEAYKAFDLIYRSKDFCVQKSPADFEAIVYDYRLDGYPPKYDLPGMARIADVWALLKLYAAANPRVKLRIGMEDDTTYLICNGWVEAVDGLTADIKVDSRLLCRLLFGYRIDELSAGYGMFFACRQPVMNLMLE